MVRRAQRRFLPVAVWFGTIAGVLWLLPHAAPSTPILGIVQADRTEVIVPVQGRLASLVVDRHARVDAGQVIGRLCDEDLRLRLRQTRFELESLQADLRAGEAELAAQARRDGVKRELDVATELRRRTSDVDEARLEELQTQAEIEEARIHLNGLDVEATRQAALERQGIAPDATLVRVETERRALERRIEELDKVLVQQRTQLAAARQRLAEFQTVSDHDVPLDAVLEPMRWRLKAQETAIERIALDGRKLDLVAPSAGYVESVHAAAGQWVIAGAKLVTIVDPDSRRILAYVPERTRERIRLDGVVEVVRQATFTRRQAAVLTVSPALVQLPRRLWRNPQAEEWGWEIVLAASADEAAGERVSILPTF